MNKTVKLVLLVTLMAMASACSGYSQSASVFSTYDYEVATDGSESNNFQMYHY